jgi:3-methyladenine DNA glycosylase AlkD
MLQEAAEPDYAAFSSKLVPGRKDIIGVRVPRMRAIAKDIAKDDWRLFLEDTPRNFEEVFVRGLVIATAAMDTDERIPLTDRFLDMIDNWSVCDSFCGSWKFPRRDSERVYDYFASLMDSGDEFRMRASMVFRMSKFIDDGHVGDILSDIQVYRHEGYYYRMGAAWAGSFCYIKYPDRTREALESGRMDDWTFRKTIQKICESYRVPEADKEYLKRLRD